MLKYHNRHKDCVNSGKFDNLGSDFLRTANFYTEVIVNACITALSAYDASALIQRAHQLAFYDSRTTECQRLAS
jgi:hypothetical protein